MSKKFSQFTAKDIVADSDYVNVTGSGVNRRVAWPDFLDNIYDRIVTPFIYPTIDALQEAPLRADEDSPVYVRVEETEYRLYKITNIAPGVNDITLDNGNTATAQSEYRDIGFVVGPATSSIGALATYNNETGTLLAEGPTPSAVGVNLIEFPDSAADGYFRKKSDNTLELLTGGQLKTNLSLNNVDNTSDSQKVSSGPIFNALALKADLFSPALIGTPTAPTAAADTNTTQVATTAYVQGELTDRIQSVATISDLKALDTPANGKIVAVSSVDGGDFLYISSSTAAASFDFIVPNSGAGRYFRLKGNGTEEIWLEQLGAIKNDSSFDNSPVINAALRIPNKTIKAGAGVFYCRQEINWPGHTTPSCSGFFGAGNNDTFLDFTLAPANTFCLSLADATASLNRRGLGGFRIRGIKAAIGVGTIGIRFNRAGLIGTAATRIHLSDAVFENHAIGIDGEYSWNNQLDKVETINCTRATRGGSQCNTWLWNNPVFLNSDQIATLENCEGWQMNTPVFQNINSGSPATEAIGLRQSSLTVVTPYYEGLEDVDAVFLGASGDTLPSIFQSFGGVSTENLHIAYRERLRHQINIDGPRMGITATQFDVKSRSSVGVYGSLTNSSSISSNGSLRTSQEQCVQSFGKSATGFGNHNSTPVTQPFYTTISRVTSGTFTHNITGLTVGATYTLAMLARAQSGTTDCVIRQVTGGGTINSASDLMLLPGEPLEVRYLCLEALSTQITLVLPFNTPIDFYLFRVYLGSVIPKIDPFYTA